MKNLKSIIKNQKSKILKFRRARRRLLSVLIVVLVVIGSYQIWAYINPDSAGAWWDDGWLFRQRITFGNSGSQTTDKYVVTEIDTESLIDSGQMNADCSDVRFTDINGKLLEHEDSPEIKTPVLTGVTKKAETAPIDDSFSISNVTVGTNEVLVVIFHGMRTHDNNPGPFDVDSITFNGDSMSLVIERDGTTTNREYATSIWILTNPDVGTYTVSGSLSRGIRTRSAAAMTFANVDKSNPVGNVGSDSTTGSDSSQTINISTGKINGLLVGGAIHRGDNSGTVGVSSPGSTEYNNVTGSGNQEHKSGGGIKEVPTEGSNSITFAMSSGNGTGLTSAAFELRAAGDEDAMCNSATSQFKVLMPTIVSGENVIQMYYGNPSAVSSSVDLSSKTEFTPTSGPSYGSIEKGPAPVGYWKMDEGSGSDVYDSMSSGNNGTLSGATWQTAGSCIFGQCLLFDGSNDVVTIANTPLLDFDQGLSEAVSISFWVNPSSDGESDNGQIFAKGSHLWCRTDNESGGLVDLECSLDLATTDATVNIADGLAIGQWHHVEITYADDGDDDLLVYIDGQLKGTGNGSGAPVGTDSSPLLIGGDTSANFHGYIDDFKIFAYERTADQVKTDYLKGASAAGSNIAVGIGGTAMPDPIAWWRLDEMNGTTANDSTSSGLSGTITGATWTREGKYSSALSFDGDDYVAVADTATLDITGDFTLSVWVNRVAGGSGTRDVIAKYNASSPNGGYKLGVGNQGEVYCGTANGTSYVESYTDTGMVTDTSGWVHLAAVRSGTGCRVYVNGLDMTTTFATHTTLTANAEALRIGSSSNGVQYWHGSIDDVKIYDVALTADQVKTDYNATSALNVGTGVNERADIVDGDYQGSLMGYWPMDENTGTSTTANKAGTANGTLTSITESSWVPGKYGSALQLDGGADYVDIGAGPSTVRTISFWVKPTTTTEYFINLTSTTDYIWSNAGTLTATGLSSPTIYIDGVPSTAITAGAWHHVAVVTTTAENASNFDIGRTQNTNYLEGIIDEVKLFSTALTPAQVAYEYNRGAPLAWYRMDECQGATINDASGNGFTGTLNIGGSGTYTSAGTCGSGTGTHAWNAGTNGKFSSATSFDGTDDYIDFGDVSTFDFGANQDFTVATWVKTNINPVTDTYPFILNKDGGSPRSGFSIVANVAQFSPIWRGAIWVSGTQYFCSGATDITDNQWHHLVLQRSGSNLSVYEDGNLANTCAASDSSITNTANFAIGSYSNLSTGWFNGLVDDVRIYNYALSPEQVKSVMNGGTVRFE